MNAASASPLDVTVVMPTWNRTQFLEASLDSVLAQTFAFKELIIADDGSEAPARALLEKYAAMPRVRVLWLAHRGNPGAVRNAAIHAASGRYIAFADSDDVWYPEKLQRQADALRAHPQCRWSYTSWRCIDAQDRPVPRLDDPRRKPGTNTLLESLANFQIAVPLPSVLVERALLFEAGLFEESMSCYEDYDLWIRLAARSEAATLSEPLVKVRRHDAHFLRGASYVALHDRERYLRRALTLVQAAPVRARLHRMHALNSAQLAWLAALAGEAGEAVVRLRGSVADGWTMPRWWLAAARAHSRLWALRARRIWAHWG